MIVEQVTSPDLFEACRVLFCKVTEDLQLLCSLWTLSPDEDMKPVEDLQVLVHIWAVTFCL